MAVSERRAAIGGLNVCCRSESGAGLDDFARLALHPPIIGQTTIDYDIGQLAPNAFRVTCDGQTVAETPFAQNLAILIQNDVPLRLEAFAPSALWLHAALVCDDQLRGLLLLGDSGLGKSTAALTLTLTGWRYLAEDRVLWRPEMSVVHGMSWAIRFKGRPHALRPLERLGFEVYEERYQFTSDAYRVLTFVRPPPDQTHCGAVRLQAILFLERGEPGICDLTPGQLLARLWPTRIARQTDPGLALLPALIHSVAQLPAAVVATMSPEQLPSEIRPWLDRVWP